MTLEIRIEKGVPIPNGDRIRKYPFGNMQVGDSAFFPGEKVNGRAYRASRSMGTRNNTKFVARPEADGIRIWRTE